MRGFVAARRPDKEDNPSAPHAKAMKPHFAVAFPVIFHRDHRKIENRLELCEIDLVLPEVLAALRLVPGDQQ